MSDAIAETSASKTTGNGATQQVDVAVVGAGFAGLFLLHRLRKAGFTAVAVDEADDVGGTWYWNRYPGARCDIQTIDYSYTFDPELDTAWKWSEKAPPSRVLPMTFQSFGSLSGTSLGGSISAAAAATLP